MKREKTALCVSVTAIISALYVVLTLLSASLGLSSMVVQFRLSEALCVLSAFTPYGIIGLFLGCLISNLLVGGLVFDVIFGSFATLLGAIGTYLIGKKNPILAVIPPVFFNTLIIPFVLVYAYGAEQSLWFLFFSVGMGELLSAGVLGCFVYRCAERVRYIFK